VTTATADAVSHDDAGRWELLRALGAATLLSPPASDAVAIALGLPTWQRADHTRLFVMELPPYAAIHLGAEGALGGEGAERVAGVWRALGLTPPSDADHLASLLALYAHLGHSAHACRTEAARQRTEHARAVVLHEHLWSWVPGYLTAASGDHAARPWADLLRRALTREVAQSPAPGTLPAALREAPAPLTADVGLPDLLDALTAPIRTGFVITWADLSRAAADTGVGLRRGERRFALKAMFEQDAPSTLAWLADHARTWAARHQPGNHGHADPGTWWRRRAEGTALVLHDLARRAGSP
jgi:TorA maturation chaperone TorD